MVVHEASHAVAALLVGGRRVRLVRRGFFWAVAAELPGSRWAEVAFVAAGPLANLVLGGVAGAAGPHLWLFGAVQVLTCVLALMPAEGSDGQQLWRLWSARSVSRRA